jgi:hypothetical protein
MHAERKRPAPFQTRNIIAQGFVHPGTQFRPFSLGASLNASSKYSAFHSAPLLTRLLLHWMRLPTWKLPEYQDAFKNVTAEERCVETSERKNPLISSGCHPSLPGVASLRQTTLIAWGRGNHVIFTIRMLIEITWYSRGISSSRRHDFNVIVMSFFWRGYHVANEFDQITTW